MWNDATEPSMSEPDSETAIEAASSAPAPEPGLVCGASLTDVTVIEAVAGVASSAPLLSTEAYWKLVEPLKLAAGTKYTVAALPLAVTLPPAARAVVSVLSL